jgi:AraC-like DNA-binding protein
LGHHTHRETYAAILLSGGYEEAGDYGRFQVQAGDVILHERFEAHLDRFPASGAFVLNLRLPMDRSFLQDVASVADADSIARAVERSPTEAADLLLSVIATRPSRNIDWPDELAAALIQNPSLNLSVWSDSKGLAPWTVSRGFAQVFGISPSAFRVRTRARHAWKAIQTAKSRSRRSPPISTLPIRLT